MLGMNIYVSNLSSAVTDEDLKGYFGRFGHVTTAKIINDRVTGRSKCFGFVEMPDTAAAHCAIAALNGGNVGGRNLIVVAARLDA